MIKIGFLQQDQFDEIDAYCVSRKQIIILVLIMNFYKAALGVIKNGAPLVKVTSLPVCEEIIRIKSKYKNDEVDKIDEVKANLENQMGELQRMYRKVGAV